MYHFIPNLTKIMDRTFDPVIELFRKLKFKPDYLTITSLVLSLISGVLFFLKYYNIGFGVLAVALLFDIFDGALARKLNLTSDKGEFKDMIADRISELFVFLAFALNGSIGLKLFGLSYYAVVLNTLLRKRAKLDLGFKRTTLFLFYIFDLNVVFSVIFIGNIVSFVLQLLVVDYEVDRNQVIKRNKLNS